MAGTFLCPNTCGFAKIAALEISREIPIVQRRERDESSSQYQARLKANIFKEFSNTFGNCLEKFTVESLQFHKRLPGLRNAINKWNFRKAYEKQRYLETFSRKQWLSLSLSRQNEHSFTNCKGCAFRYSQVQALFPVKSAFLKGKAKENLAIIATGEVNRLRGKQALKPTSTNIRNAAKAIYDKVSPLFEKTFNTSFAEGLSKVPGLDLQQKTVNEKRSDRRNQYRSTKENIEKQMEETAFLR